MNRTTTTILALAFAALSGAASAQTGFAGDISVETKPFVSTKSRAEVRAELDAYRKEGVDLWAQHYNPLTSFVSSKSRAQVTAELRADPQAAAALTGEDSGSRQLASAFRSSKTRADVTASYLANRDAVAALNGEDSGSKYLGDQRAAEHRAARLAASARVAARQ